MCHAPERDPANPAPGERGQRELHGDSLPAGWETEGRRKYNVLSSG